MLSLPGPYIFNIFFGSLFLIRERKLWT
jgi:hypothetical protein